MIWITGQIKVTLVSLVSTEFKFYIIHRGKLTCIRLTWLSIQIHVF